MKWSTLAIPVLVAVLLVYALVKKVNVYKAFIEGVGESLRSLVSLLPYLAAMLTAISLLKGSGALSFFTGLISPIAEKVGVKAPLVPLIALRPFSGSGALAMLKEILSEYGADSPVGREASVIVGSTETVFYTVSVYFGAVGVTKTRQAVPAAIISGLVGTAVGLVLA
ncbi:MAG: spore maturation protein [Clostridiales bacterium]|nr:spore maturation protein [Clostridiales bacterium]